MGRIPSKDFLKFWRFQLSKTSFAEIDLTFPITDPSIGAAALGITPEGIFKDITTFGLLIVDLVELR